MDNFFLLILIGFAIGTLGTLIGAGGGFLLVPLLLLAHPDFGPEVVTAISIAIVAGNAISGSIAYAKSGRIDYKAGLLFALFTIPGSIIGVFLTGYIPKEVFGIIFGMLLLVLSTYLILKNRKSKVEKTVLPARTGPGWKTHSLTDKSGKQFTYNFNQTWGIVISVLVGFLSPLLGIGGGIIHVPAMVQWLQFPVYIATATSHFILAIMSTISVGVHLYNGDYSNPLTLHIIGGLLIGVLPGAQLGAYLSHKIPTVAIISRTGYLPGPGGGADFDKQFLKAAS